MDGSPNLVYRTNEFPGLGFLLKKEVYIKYLKDNLEVCCKNRLNIKFLFYNFLFLFLFLLTRAWTGLVLNTKNISFDVLIPDVSRVHYKYYSGFHNDSSYRENIFNRKRKTTNSPNEIFELDSLANRKIYESSVVEKIKNSIDFPNIDSCFVDGILKFPTTNGLIILKFGIIFFSSIFID